ncbi:MAG: nitronate monooxygenase [Candidatus Planktophila sp.]|nr:nitronate monooxygenase [Candidatus Planktophila sp.]
MEIGEISSLPRIIQGGMGIGVSSWPMAKAVAQAGGLGVVSGTAIDSVISRRLQDGDSDGSLRRAIEHFPDQEFADEVIRRYFIEGGRERNTPYLLVPKLSLLPTEFSTKFLVLANFVEVWLAKEAHTGLIGINFLEKLQLSTPASIYGAILAGVDYVLMGAGIPSEIPRVIRELSNHKETSISIAVENASTKYYVPFDPSIILGANKIEIAQPKFLAIISSHALAAYLNRDVDVRPDGFVVEGVTAGGHNAPPRGNTPIGSDGQSQFTIKDDADIEKIRATGLPFWLAGGYATPEKLNSAISQGAVGVQVGSIFALSHESGITKELRRQVLTQLADKTLNVITDPLGSPTSFPFKYAELAETISDNSEFDSRVKLCDLGYLRTVVERPNKRIVYRCSGEPNKTFNFKGGVDGATVGKKCLCNALMANIGLAQIRPTGYQEAALVTLGSDLAGEEALLAMYPDGWSAVQAMEYLNGC